MKFNMIVMDPPWSFQDKLTMSDVARGASSNYNTLNNDDIKNLNIKEISDPNGTILALWVPSSLLEVGVKCMNSYGFKLKQTYVWVKIKNEPLKKLFSIIRKSIKLINIKNLKKAIKTDIDTFCINSNILNFGMGRLFRQSHEICLIGINNKNIYKLLENKSQRSVSLHKNSKHSSKPENLQNSLEEMFPSANKIELFARRKRQGWLCVGNDPNSDTPGEDIRVSIQKLLDNGKKDINN